MPLTSPKLEKLELNTLANHLPRYTTSGMSSREVQWWKAYISTLQDSTSTEHNDQWVLKTLENLQTLAHCHSQTPSLPPILDDLSQIVSSERQDIPAMYIGNQRRQQRPAQPARRQQQPAQPARRQQQPTQPVRRTQQSSQPTRRQQQPAQPVRRTQQPAQPTRQQQQPAQPVRRTQQPAQPTRQQQQPVRRTQQPAQPTRRQQRPAQPTAQLRGNEVCTDTAVTSCIATYIFMTIKPCTCMVTVLF